MPTNSPEVEEKPLGEPSPPGVQSAQLPRRHRAGNQLAQFKICSCLHQSTGPSLPHCHSEINSYCLGHFISRSYPWLVPLKEVLRDKLQKTISGASICQSLSQSLQFPDRKDGYEKKQLVAHETVPALQAKLWPKPSSVL